MSHANGEVIYQGKVVGLFEYDGTSDIAVPAIWDTNEELEAHWRNNDWKKCTCGQPNIDVILYTDYGYGFHWPAKACLKCKAITASHQPFPYDGEDLRKRGHPLKAKDRGKPSALSG
ncbi:MAG: hypothetical protein AAB389_02970 [Patescibacteria group bacterium]